MIDPYVYVADTRATKSPNTGKPTYKEDKEIVGEKMWQQDREREMRERYSRSNGEVGCRQWADLSYFLGRLKSHFLIGCLLFLLFILYIEGNMKHVG